MHPMAAEGTVRYSADGGVATLTLDRPEKLNALAAAMRDELLAGLERAAASADVRVIAVRGAGRAFCAGGDLGAMVALMESGADAGPILERMAVGAAVLRTIREADKPVVALVHGVAAGAGTGIACAADLVWAAPDARFFFSWGKLGLHPDWGASWTLARRVGAHTALQWCLAGEGVGADAALAAGLVTRVGPPEQWEAGLATLAEASPVATAALKHNLHAAVGRDLSAGIDAEYRAQAESWASDACAAGLRAFADRRSKG